MRVERGPARTLVTRGALTESTHLACVVIAEPPRRTRPDGEIRCFGDPATGTFLRSVAKPFQTLALFRSGAVDAFGLSAEEIAVVTASHAGELFHHQLVERLLRRNGLEPEQLRCGIHPPFAASERRRRQLSGEALSVLGNNCSGKHSGMLLHARLIGAELATYLEPEHPVQAAVRLLLEEFADMQLVTALLGVDGCGAPTYSLPLAAIARAFARLSDDSALARFGLVAARDRLEQAVRQQPRAFSGEDRLPFLLSTLSDGQWLAKEGAEGVFIVWGRRGAIAIKCLDGAERGYRYLLPVLLHREGWIDAAAFARWQATDPPLVHNVAGLPVGDIRVELPALGIV
ncbi:MAG: asparaginase [Planctomycetota bacterium]